MNARSGELAILLGVLLLTGAASWWLLLRNVPESDPTTLDALDSTLGGWQAVDLEIDQDVAEMLNADHNVQRAYHHPAKRAGPDQPHQQGRGDPANYQSISK